MIIALVPARGGSKRLPRKNVLPFAGKPLICHSIDAALAARTLAGCYVSTEDPEIAEVAGSAGAHVIPRPPELATDRATTAAVARHAVRHLDGMGLAPTAVVTLQPTNPLRPPWVIDRAVERFRVGDADAVVAVTRSHRKLGGLEDGCFVPEYLPGTRSQDMPARYFENGVVYVTDAALLRDHGDFFGRRMVPLELEPLYAMGDIDTALDFAIAEFLFQTYRSHFIASEQDPTHVPQV